MAEESIKYAKQHRKMTKMLTKLWDAAEEEKNCPFAREDHLLNRIGARLDLGKYDKEGKRGWEKFAVEVGKVYGRFMISGNPHSQLAQKHLDLLSELLTKLDPSGALSSTCSMAAAEAGSSAPPSRYNGEGVAPKKRKLAAEKLETNDDVLKKSKVSSSENENDIRSNKSKSSSAALNSADLSIAQREERALSALVTYLEQEYGVTKAQVNSIKARTTQRASQENRYDTVFVASDGKILKTRNDVARFLGLTDDILTPPKPSNKIAENNKQQRNKNGKQAVVKVGQGRPKNQRDLENEKRRLQKELQRLMKAHTKSSKALDEYISEHQFDRYPIDDDLLVEEIKQSSNSCSMEPKLNAADVTADITAAEFPGIPEHAIPDILMIWDFLNTFHKSLALSPVSLSDFVSALTFKPITEVARTNESTQNNIPDPTSSYPLYLAEAHLALLNLLLSDQRSDEWWWSTLPDENDTELAQQELVRKSSLKEENSDEESDDDSEDEEAKVSNSSNFSVTQEDEGVSFAIPPSIVDLLLPPTKPVDVASNNSLIVSSFTWPYIAGIAARRILNHLQKLRLEVDDSIRVKKRSKELASLTPSEQKERHEISIERIFTECMCSDQSDNVSVDVEGAIESLCNPVYKSEVQQHGVYATLSPLQKLAILRILIEAAYDTSTVSQLIEDNFNARTSALKSLENEEKKLKKQAKEEALRDEELAREYLAADAREAFCREKREELLKEKRFSALELDEMADEDIINIDPETKLEYDALPTGTSFAKSQVMIMVEKIQEAAAFDTHHLTVLTLDDIVAREEEKINSLIEEIESITKSTNDEIVDRATSIRLNKLHRELQRLQNLQNNLPDIRDNAIRVLKESLDEYSGSTSAIKAYRHAIKIAKQAKLMGTYESDEELEGIWVLDMFRDVVIENRAAEKRKRIMDLQKDLVAKRDKCFVRTDCLGKDKSRNIYWSLSNFTTSRNSEVLPCAVWIEKQDTEYFCDVKNEKSNLKTIGACDFEIDLIPSEDTNQKEEFLSFSRKEYHHSGTVSALPKMKWGCFTNDYSIRRVIRRLNDRGTRECNLKESLKEISEKTSNLNNSGDSENNVVQSNGDEEHFKLIIENSDPNEAYFKSISSFTSAIGKRVRMVQQDEKGFEMGTVIGWFVDNCANNLNEEINADEPSALEKSNEHESTSTESLVTDAVASKRNIPLWRVVLDCDGQEIDLDGDSLRHGLLTAFRWKNQVSGYKEDDMSIYTYFNSLGKFCGKNTSDAQIASTPFAFSRIILRKENEMYSKLKNRVVNNGWGSKAALRTNWIQTLKDESYNFNVVRDCLLTLEEAINDLILNMQNEASSQIFVENTVVSIEVSNDLQEYDETMAKLSSDPSYRSELELESIGQQKITSLWSSSKIRSVFRCIVKMAPDVGILALCLDLLVRNCMAYIDSNTVKKASRSNKGRVVDEYYYVDEFDQPYSIIQGARRPSARRRNAWQQQQEGFYTDFF